MIKKIQVIELIEQGLDNASIAEQTGIRPEYIRACRSQYNAVASERAPSRLDKPKLGTKMRRAYDIIVANPDATSAEVSKVVNLSGGSILALEKRYGLTIKRERGNKA